MFFSVSYQYTERLPAYQVSGVDEWIKLFWFDIFESEGLQGLACNKIVFGHTCCALQALMSTFSLFDIAGPIMVGPSSSHTAGAAKIGQFARAIFDATPNKAHFLLHGSFGEVYKGHATDRALLAGVMKCAPNDARIKDAFEFAKEKKIKYEFEPGNLGSGYHPNSVRITLENKKRSMTIVGSSIGGGNIVIVQINGFDVHLTGNGAEQYFTLVVQNENLPGMLAKITGFLGKKEIRIVNMQSCYLAFENKVLSVISIEKALTLKEILDLESEAGVLFVRSLNKIAQ